MNPIQNISIPSACHESWNNMLPAEGGRHCGQCCKTVVNFAAMTDNEIISYLASNKAVCGRFESSQLNNLNIKLRSEGLVQNGWWKRAAIILGLLGSVTEQVSAQRKPEMVTAADSLKGLPPVDHIKGDIVLASDPVGLHTISGFVTGKDDGLPIPGAVVKIEGTNDESSSGANGKFKLIVPDTASTLLIKAVGYKQQEIKLATDLPYGYNVVLESSPVTTQCVVVGGVIVRRMSLMERIWYRMKRLF